MVLEICRKRLFAYEEALHLACENFLEHDEHAVDVLEEGFGEELGVDVDYLGCLHVLIVEFGIGFFEVGEGHNAIGVAVEELEAVLGLPTVAKVLTVHALEKTGEVVGAGFKIVEVENLVELLTVELYDHIEDAFLVGTYGLGHTGLEGPGSEEVFVVDVGEFRGVAVEHTVDNEGNHATHTHDFAFIEFLNVGLERTT